MRARALAELTVALVLILLVGSWCDRGRSRALATAEVAEESTRRALESARIAEDRLAEVQARLEIELLYAAVQRDSAVALADSLARARPTIVERVIEVAGDSASVVEAVLELEQAHQEEVGALRVALAFADSIVDDQRVLILEHEHVNASLRVALDASLAEANSWKQAARPGWLDGTLGRIALPVAFAGGLYIGARLF